jgi:hypothetical protein
MAKVARAAGDKAIAEKATAEMKATGTPTGGGSGAVVPGHRVVVFVQENKTTDFYLPPLPGGARGSPITAICSRRRRTSQIRTRRTDHHRR